MAHVGVLPSPGMFVRRDLVLVFLRSFDPFSVFALRYRYSYGVEAFGYLGWGRVRSLGLLGGLSFARSGCRRLGSKGIEEGGV